MATQVSAAWSQSGKNRWESSTRKVAVASIEWCGGVGASSRRAVGGASQMEQVCPFGIVELEGAGHRVKN
jgi:hypothetical protein